MTTMIISDQKSINAIAEAIDMYIEMEWDTMTESRESFTQILTMIKVLHDLRPKDARNYYIKIIEEFLNDATF